MQKISESQRSLMFILAFTILAGIAHAQLADSPWPMVMHDAQHTGRSPYVGPDSVILAWTYQTPGIGTVGGGIPVSPTIGYDGTIYVFSKDLYALNPNGSLKWIFEEDFYSAKSSPTVSIDGTIFIGGDDYLFAIHHNGTLKWKYEIATGLGDAVRSSCVIGSDGTLYVGAGYALYALNPDGTLKWKFEVGIGDEIRSSPALASDGTIYFGCQDGYLYAVNPNGIFKWKYKIADPSVFERSSPSIGPDGTIYIGSTDRKIYAINPNGSLKWNISSGGNTVDTTPAIGIDSTVYVAATLSLKALNPDNGNTKWSYYIGTISEVSPAIDGNGTIYCGADYNFYAINPDGTLKWSYEFPARISSNPIIDAHGTIYIGTKDGMLNAFAQATAGQTPDLIISDISITPINGATPGGDIKIGAAIQDLTGLASAHCKVSFYYDDKDNFIDTTSIYVPVGQTGFAEVSWYTQQFEVREYLIIARVSESVPPESDTTNNEAETEYKLLPFIQPRIDSAQPGDTVWIEPGTYFENITLKNGINIKSQFGPELTIIDGRKADDVVNADNTDRTAVLDGFTITNGKSLSGGGITIDLGAATIKNNIIINNEPNGIGHRGFQSAWVEHNLIKDHTYSLSGIGINVNNSQAVFINNTIVGNNEGVHAVGLYVPSPTIVNCILWDNGEDLTYTAVATYSNIEDGDPGVGNISADPKFLDKYYNNYRLQCNSPCIDAGNPSSPLDPDGTRTDMGAYYFDQSSFVVTSPNGGEIWSAGGSQNILWVPLCSINSVKLEYSPDSGTTWTSIADGVSNDGSFPWTIPNDPSEHCLVKISDAIDGEPFDVSDSTFVIGSKGDVNGDGAVDIFDLVKLINFILEKVEPDPYEFWAGDINDDGVLDIFDVVKMINIILSGNPTALAKMAVSPAQIGELSLPDLELMPDHTIEIPVYANFDGTVAGIQLELRYDPQALKVLAPVLTSRTEQMELASAGKNGKLTILVYSTSGNVIEAGDGAILNFTVQALSGFKGATQLEVENAIAVNGKAEAISVNFSTGNIAALKPQGYLLSQNYPNPFNAQTVIKYQLPKSDRVVLKIYNTLGQKIRTLVDEEHEAGYYNINWDGRNNEGLRVSSGIYIYKIQTQDFVKVKKMLFVM